MRTRGTARAADSVWKEFQAPPQGFGEVAFYWWLGDRLDRERILWQLDQLAGAGISGLQVNYAHGTAGGNAWGLTYPSDPPLFSEEWWDLFAWFREAARSRGMAVSLSDYTLGIGQGWFCDEIARDPLLRGTVLEAVVIERASDLSTTWTEDTVGAYAVREDDGGGTPRIERLSPFKGGVDGRHDARVVVVRAVSRRWSLDPMNPEVGRQYVEKFFQRFEDRLGIDRPGRLDFFFSDEMDFGVTGHLWTARLPEEFRRRKGYDLMDELPALFVEAGPRTPKVRLDYRDVMVALTEENFFAPVYRWHEKRKMTYGCDHGFRGRKVTEFGDYFRTQRWNQGPGCDQPHLESDVVKNKVASSIAHLYRRPRVWLEGFYSSGWGTTSGQIADAIFRNFAMGHNLLTLHGLYYSTHGGWWEWAPPCNHFRMPYWEHFKKLLKCTERLSFLLTRGAHVCDVAILYPVAAVEADTDGIQSVETAFTIAEELYRRGVDFDFIDFQSLAESTAESGRFSAGDESYRTLIIPAMRTIRFSTLEAAERIVAAGGSVVFVGELPRASDRAGREDDMLSARLRALLDGGPGAELVPGVTEVIDRLSSGDRDFRVLDGTGTPFVQHRKIAGNDLFFVHGLEAGSLCEFRAVGRVVLWDPWTASERAVPVEQATETHTRLRLPEGHPLLLWFGPGEAERSSTGENLQSIPLDGRWLLQPIPTMDNRWGDFRLPAFDGLIGPEIRTFDFSPAGTDDLPSVESAAWTACDAGYGPVAEVYHAAGGRGKSGGTCPLDGCPGRQALASWRFGPMGDPGFQGYHGLKGRIGDEMIVLTPGPGVHFVRTILHAQDTVCAHWNLGGDARPSRAWVDGEAVEVGRALTLQRGAHEVVLEYSEGGRIFAVFSSEPIPATGQDPAWFGPLQSRWFNNNRVLPQGIRCSGDPLWVRWMIPPGTRAMTWGILGELLETSVGGTRVSARSIARNAARFPSDGTAVWQIDFEDAPSAATEVLLRVKPFPGLTAGHCIPEPVALTVGPFFSELDDWANIPGFACYSGGMQYSIEFECPPHPVVGLDLGDLSASAEVWVNGKSAGIRCMPPWRFDIGDLVRAGRNTLTVDVRSALSNHYKTIPTEYRGTERCGLFGPVRLLVGG
jgi:hypothetical protein